MVVNRINFYYLRWWGARAARSERWFARCRGAVESEGTRVVASILVATWALPTRRRDFFLVHFFCRLAAGTSLRRHRGVSLIFLVCRYTLARFGSSCRNVGTRSRINAHLGTWDYFGRSRSHRRHRRDIYIYHILIGREGPGGDLLVGTLDYGS